MKKKYNLEAYIDEEGLFKLSKKINKTPLCVDKYNITHRVYAKSFALSNDYKYLCLDTRDCFYKTVKENRQYCNLHLEKFDKDKYVRLEKL